jgi:HD-like signal output (HDOD) protein
MERIKGLEEVVKRVGDLPAVPAVVSEVLSLMESPDVDMASVGQAIERDPALSAKILRVSNSSYYGMRQYVGTLKLALVVLGISEVKNIVLGISVFNSLRNGEQDAILGGDLWKHSFLVAGMSKMLGARLRLGLRGEDFVSGLLHDIGKLVLMRQVGGPYAEIYRASGGKGMALCEAEVQPLGFTHAQAAAVLAMHWNFPMTLTDALLLHHPSPDMALREARDPQLAAVVRIADLAAHQEFAEATPPTDNALEDQEAWEILDGAPSPIPAGERGDVLAAFSEELRDAAVPAF